MKMKAVLLFVWLAVFATSQVALAQSNAWVARDVLILQSTKGYKSAVATARQAATRLHAPLQLAGNLPNSQTGLSLSRKDCATNGFEYPAYVARGRGNDRNTYISVEYSAGYKGFAPGYYLVVAAVAQPGAALVQKAFVAARQWYPDAYAKRTQVWVGCIH